MKKFRIAVSVILVLALISAAAPVCLASGERSVSFFVATDIHVNPTELYGSIEDKITTDIPMFEHVSPQGQMNAESEAIVNVLLREFAESSEDILLLSGDLSWGNLEAHKILADKFRAVEQETGKSIFVICGNHDINTADGSDAVNGGTTMADFKEVYADFGYNEALNVHDTSCSYAVNLNDGYRLIAVDSCVHGKSDGAFSESVLSWTEAQAASAKADGMIPIVIMHHSLVPHFSVQPMTDNYEQAAQRLADCGIEYVFSGHMHANDISLSVTDSGNSIYDIMTDALLSYPNAYRVAHFSENTAELKTEYVTEIDTDDLPAGFTDAQLEYINSDFHGYAYGFFEAGMSAWLQKYIGSASKVAPILGVEKGTEAYDTLDRLMGIIGNSLKLPVYDDGSTPGVNDSIEEIAATMGYELPETEYDYTYKLVAKIMGGFFAGDGEFSADDVEIQLLYTILKGAISDALGTLLADGIMPEGLGELLEAVGAPLPTGTDLSGHFVSETAKLLFMRTAGNFAVASIIGPLLEGGIIKDYCEPTDLDVTLDGQAGADTVTAPLTLLARITMVIESILVFVITHLGTVKMYK